MMDAIWKSVEYYKARRETSTEAQPRGAIDLTDENAIKITLTPRSDATTTIHEMGHLFRWLLEQQAEIFPDDEQLQADWNAVRDFGDHEKFADAAIEYAMTGDAPSPSLRRTFEMFRQCLTRFYDAIRGNTGVKLTDEIKGVFDRILAANARKEPANIPVPKSANMEMEDGVFFQMTREPPPNEATRPNQDQGQPGKKKVILWIIGACSLKTLKIRPKVKKIAELFDSHLDEVTKSPDDWTSFLDSAA